MSLAEHSRRKPLVVDGVTASPTEFWHRDGTWGPGIVFDVVGRDLDAPVGSGTRRFYVDLEVLRHLERIIPEMVLTAQEEFNVRRARER